MTFFYRTLGSLKLSSACIIISSLLLASCQSSPEPAGEYHLVDETSFKIVVKNPNVQILDVRTHSEYLKGHVPFAINIDINGTDFNNKAKEKLDKNYPVAIYCLKGQRSNIASGILVDMGYEVYELEKGIQGYTGEVNYGEN